MNSKPRPFIPWVGGKRRLAKHILPLFPKHKCYVAPFAGGAALFFMKKPASVEVLNDIDGELVNLYRVVQNHPDELLRQLNWTLTSRQILDWERMKDPRTLTDVQRAARFYQIIRTSFGNKWDGTFGSTCTAIRRIRRTQMEADLASAHRRLEGVSIEHLDWARCIEKYDRPQALFYCDPPYPRTQGYGVPFAIDQYTRIAEYARTVKGKMIISISDTPEMREVFVGLRLKRVAIVHGISGGKKTSELILCNW